MGGQNVGPIAQKEDGQNLNDAYSNLLDDLNEAYWAASSVEVKDRFYGLIEIVTALITQLDATDLQSRDAAYTALVSNVADVNKQLNALQQQISSMISRINTAATVVSDISKVLAIAAKMFPA